jgi:hypothetical protein
MSSYAVLWQNDSDKPHSGRLDIGRHGLLLHGGRRGNEIRVVIPFDKILGVERDTEATIGPSRAIRLETDCVGSLRIAAVGGIAVVSEILDLVRAATIA